MEKLWHGETDCGCCSKKDLPELVDGKTKMGPWAVMCLDCHKRYGVGLGTGKGQQYKRAGSGAETKYVKVAG